jgi:seryl-tRNA synthetase
MNKKIAINYPIDNKTEKKIIYKLKESFSDIRDVIIDNNFNVCFNTESEIDNDFIKKLIHNIITEVQRPETLKTNSISKPFKQEVKKYGFLTSKNGSVCLTGHALQVYNEFIDIFDKIKLSFGSEILEIPQTIETQELQKIKYDEHFPQNFTVINNLTGESLDTQCTGFSALPAACFHTYRYLENANLNSIELIGVLGKCFRNEEKNLISEFRLTNFTMSEIVIFGDYSEIIYTRQKIMELIFKLFRLLGLSGGIQLATDPFYNAKNKQSYQLNNKIKYELIFEFNGGKFSVASFNLHEKFFTSKYQIKYNNNLAFSGCNAFGIERWVYAFLLTHGSEKTPFSFDIHKLLAIAE